MKYRMNKQREIKNKIRDAKEKWMTYRCKEMEELERKHDMFYMYKKVREVAGLYTRKSPNMLIDNTGRLIIDEHEVLEA